MKISREKIYNLPMKNYLCFKRLLSTVNRNAVRSFSSLQAPMANNSSTVLMKPGSVNSIWSSLSCRTIVKNNVPRPKEEAVVESAENLKHSYYKEYEKMLEKLKFQYGSTPDPEVILRQLAICAVDLNDVRDERIAAQKDLAVCEKRLLNSEALNLLRTQIEILEAMFKPTIPDVPKEMDKEKCDLKYPDLDVDMKDAAIRKVDRHYRFWLWCFENCEHEVFKEIKDSMARYNLDKKDFCSGVAALFIFSSTVGGAHNTYSNYSKDEIKDTFKSKGLKMKFLLKTVDVILDLWE